MRQHHSRSARKPAILATSIAAALLAVLPARATVLTWDITPGTVGAGDSAITGGTGTWNTALGNWTADGGVTDVAWVNANLDQAIFGGNAGTVTLGTGISANALTFNTTGYIVTGNTLTLAGPTPTITVASGLSDSVASVLAGTDGLVVAGPGTLVLTGISTFSGGTTVNGGTLTLTGTNGSGRIRGALTINAGATVTTTTADALGFNAGVQVATMNINGGTYTNAVNGNNGFRTNFVLTGGNITESVASTGNAGINFQGSEGFGVTTLASSTTSTISARESIRSGNLTFTVAQGTTASGIDLNVTAVIFANGGSGIIKNGPGTMQTTAQNTFAGGTTINEGTLNIAGGGGTTGAIRGTATVNSGATLRLSTADALGFGTNRVNTLNINSGTVNVNTTGNQTFTTMALTMNAGTISGIAGSNIDLFANGTIINTLAAATSSTISGPTIGLRQNDTVFNVEDGAAAADLVINSVLTSGTNITQGNHNLIKNGAGTMQLNAANTYTGSTTVNAGTLVLGSSASLASPAISFGSGAVFDVSALPAATYTVASGRSLSAGSTSVFATDVIGNVIDNGTLTVAGAGVAGTMTIGGNLTLDGGTVNFDLANVTTVGNAVNDLAKVVNLTLSGTSSIAINKLSGALVSTGTYTLFNYSGTLTGNASNLTLSGAAGGTTRQTFTLDTSTTAGSVLLSVVGSSANLLWVGDGAANAWDINTTVNWSGAFDGNNRFFDGDAVTIDDTGSNTTPIALGVTVQPGSLTVNNTTKDFTISGAGNIGGSTGLTKNGTGKLTIGTSNSFTGPVAINAGTVSVATLANSGTASGLGAGSALSLGDASNTGTLQYTGATTTTNRAVTVNDGGGIIEVTDSAATLTDSGAFTGNGALTKTGNGALRVTGVVSNAGGVTVNGGSLTLTVNGTYSAGATVNSGATLTVSSTGGGGTGLGSGNTFVNAGGTLIGAGGDAFGFFPNAAPGTINVVGGTISDLGTASYRVTLPNLTFTGGTLTSAVGNNGDANGNYSFFGTGGTATVTTNAASTTAVMSAARIAIQSPTTFNVAAGSVTGGATPGVNLLISSNLIPFNTLVQAVTKTGSGVMQLTGTNTYLGATNINEGTLALGASGSLSSTATTVAAGAVFDVSAVTGGYTQATGRALTISPGGLLVGPATFSAGATLTGGSTAGNDVTGDLTSAGTINIGGTGTPATLTLGNSLSLNGASMAFDLANDTTAGATINDLVAVANNLTLAGTTSITVNKLNGALTTGSYTLFTYGGSLSGNASNFSIVGLIATGRQTYAINTTASPGSVLLTSTGNAADLIWTGDGTANPWDLTSNLWNNAGNADKFYDLDSVTFNNSGSASPNIAINTTVQPGALTVSSTTKDYTFSGSGAIAGATGLTKDGSRTLTISTTNSFTGPVAINNGMVSVATVANSGVASPLGAGTTISLGDATNFGRLQYTGATAGTDRPFTLGDGGGAIEVTTAGTTLTASGVFSGNGGLTKSGTGTLILSNVGSSLTGNIIVDGGTLTAAGLSAGFTGTLGQVNYPGRSITMNHGATLSFTVNNIFGNGVGNFDAPAIILNGSTLTSTRYNIIGDLTLSGATLTQSATDAGNYEGYQFTGDVTVTGTVPSTIATTNGKADHLGPNTTFDVADVTANSATDLTISAPLRNQSGDFGLGPGALTKTGAGTLTITGAQSYATLNQEAGRTNLNTSLPNAVINGDGGTLVVNANATNSTVNVNAGNSTYFTVSQTLAALTIADGGFVQVTNAPPPGFDAGADLPFEAAEVATGSGAAAVPEPASLGLLLLGTLGLLGRRRRLG